MHVGRIPPLDPVVLVHGVDVALDVVEVVEEDHDEDAALAGEGGGVGVGVLDDGGEAQRGGTAVGRLGVRW